MKTYRSENNIRMMTDTFDNLKPFDLINGWDLIDLYNQVNKSVSDFIDVDNITYINKDNISFSENENEKPYIHLQCEKDKIYYKNIFNSKQLSIKEETGYIKEYGYSSTLRSDIFFKDVFTNQVYLYLSIPCDFINNHMFKSHGGGKLDIVRKYVDIVNKSDDKWIPSNYIKIMDEFDDKYPKMTKYLGRAEKPPYFYEWRQDFILFLYLTIREYGVFNPVISTSYSILFDSGSHRLSTIPMIGYDIPMFIPAVERGNLLYLLTPRWFSLDDGKKFISFGVEINIEKQRMDLIDIDLSEVEDGITSPDIQKFVKRKFSETDVKIRLYV
ncbi:hypothetical protein CMI38_07270 [Candidatus Pacearchaeota archaeon]|nr:hypothetical protein [Candidatus Pacearchaeota archaeon]